MVVMKKNEVEKHISIVNKYPSYRDEYLKGCWKYMQGRRADDEAEGLWRVHDKLYDLKDFIDRHPGGRQWLILTEGTDVTETFETHHLTPKASDVLKKFYVRDAANPRNYKYTFNDDGFYQTLKRRVAIKLKKITTSEFLRSSKLIHDFNLVALYAFVYLAVKSESFNSKFLWTLFASQSLAWTANFSHNFMHQKDNWRMYTANLSFLNFRDFRVFHIMSHHCFPNTVTDMEVSNFETYLKWIPYSHKTTNEIFKSFLMSPIRWAMLFYYTATVRFYGLFWSETKVFYWDELISYIIPVAMILIGKDPISVGSLLMTNFHWMAIITIGSFLYTMFAVNNGHHGPDIIHEGDEFDNLDFGVFQLRAIVDRQGIDSSLFTALGYYGLHALHHLFPTLDHAILPHFEEILTETCREFSIELKKISMTKAMSDQFKQLARSKTIKLP